MNHIKQQEILNIEQQIFKSILSQESTIIYSLIAEDFIGIGFAGQHVNKEIYIKVHTNPNDPFIKYEIEHENISIDNELAFINGIQDVTAAIHLKSDYIAIFRIKMEKWKLSYWQETAIVDKPIFSTK